MKSFLDKCSNHIYQKIGTWNNTSDRRVRPCRSSRAIPRFSFRATPMFTFRVWLAKEFCTTVPSSHPLRWIVIIWSFIPTLNHNGIFRCENLEGMNAFSLTDNDMKKQKKTLCKLPKFPTTRFCLVGFSWFLYNVNWTKLFTMFNHLISDHFLQYDSVHLNSTKVKYNNAWKHPKCLINKLSASWQSSNLLSSDKTTNIAWLKSERWKNIQVSWKNKLNENRQIWQTCPIEMILHEKIK